MIAIAGFGKFSAVRAFARRYNAEWLGMPALYTAFR